MTTIDFVSELFIKVDDEIDDDKHPQANMYPSESVSVANGMCVCLLRLFYQCSHTSVISSIPATSHGITSRPS